MLDISQFLEDYDAAAADVAASNYGNYTENLKRWFYIIDEENPLGSIALELENAVDAQKWANEAVGAAQKGRGMRGDLTWPPNLRERLGIQLSLFRSFAEKTMDPAQFGFHFFRRANENFHGVVANMNAEAFVPLARDFRRHLVRVADDQPPELPASDRTVSLDHNSISYQEAIEAVDCLEELVRQKNDYDDPDDKEQKLAEIAAGRTLLKATLVR